jgi:hypothetical protein
MAFPLKTVGIEAHEKGERVLLMGVEEITKWNKDKR